MKHLLSLTFAATLLLAFGESARAGFFVAEVSAEFETVDPIGLEEGTTPLRIGEQSGASEQKQQDETPQPSLANRQTWLALTSQGGSNMAGNGGPVSNGGPPTSLIATPVPPAITPAGLTVYLLQEPALLLPVPFLDGVFRPPKA